MIMTLRNTVEVSGTVACVEISYWFRKWGRGISIVDIVLRASHSTLKYLVKQEYLVHFKISWHTFSSSVCNAIFEILARIVGCFNTQNADKFAPLGA